MPVPTTWQTIILIFSIFQGIALSLALATGSKFKSPSNRLLSWFILALVFLLATAVPVENEVLVIIKTIISFTGDTVTFLYGPLLFLYSRKLLLSESGTREWRHFIPAMIFFVVNIVVQIIGWHNLGVSFVRIYFITVNVLVFTHLYTYLYFSFKTVIRYKRQVGSELSYLPSVNYLLVINGFIAVTLTLIFLNFLGTVTGLKLGLISQEYNLVIISLLTFILAYYAMSTPEIFRLDDSKASLLDTEQKAEVALSPEETEELGQIKTNLLQVMHGDKMYLNPDLSLPEMASRMGMRKELLSKAINQGTGKNFYRFVNEFRVEEFKRKVANGGAKRLTHLGLAYESGFKSKSTFYKAFKEITGITPSEFLNAP